MTFWHYIIIGAIIQAIICVERQIRLSEVRQYTKANLMNSEFWLRVILGSIVNIIVWPISVYCEIRLIQNGA